MSVYSLLAEPRDEGGEAIRITIVLCPLAERETFSSKRVEVSGPDDGQVLLSAERGVWIAYEGLRNKAIVPANSEISRSGIILSFDGDRVTRIVGLSAGLCFLTAMASAIIAENGRGSR